MRKFLVYFLITLFDIGPDRIGYGTTFVKAINRDAESYRNDKGNAIRKYMNLTIDPCEDFYEYTCGKWEKHHKATHHHSITSEFIELENKVEKEVQELIVEPVTTRDRNIHRKVKDFYTSCIDINHIQHIGVGPYLEFISTNGGMPALNTIWRESTFNWLALISKLKASYGMNILLHMEISKDLKNHKENRVYIGKPENFPLIAKEMYTENLTRHYRDKYKTIVSKNLQKVLHIDGIKADRIATEIIDFEIRLAKAANDFQDSFEFVSLNYLNDKYRGFDFSYYVATILNLPVKSSLYIYVTKSNYITNLIKLIDETPKPIVANYIMWSAVSNFLFSNETNVEKRSKVCTQKTIEMFPKIIGSMFNRKFYQDNIKEEIDKIGYYMKRIFNEELGNVEWLGETTKRLAQYKLTNMRMEIVTYNQDDLEEHFMSLSINREKFFHNIMNVMMFDQKKMHQKLFESPKPFSNAEVEGSSISAIYMTMENLIKIPMGLLQVPFYNINYPKSVIFGQIGSIIGHEMTHGFDSNEQKFDQFGNMLNWWDENSIDNFDNNTDCLIKQYDDFRVNGRNLVKIDILDENIADSVGVKIAFKSYLQWLKDITNIDILRRETLPVDFSNTQLFFISYAQMSCTSMTPDAKIISNLIDEHGPAKFRVNGMLSNFNEFAKEFNCPPGSPMNRADKCIIY